MRSVYSHGWTRRGLEFRVVLEIEPYPELSDTQRRAIEMDYGLVDGRAAIVVREVPLLYALKLLDLGSYPAARRPQDQQIVLIKSGHPEPKQWRG